MNHWVVKYEFIDGRTKTVKVEARTHAHALAIASAKLTTIQQQDVLNVSYWTERE